MTIETFLSQSTQRLKAAGVETGRLDSLVLLEDALGLDRALLLAHMDDELPPPTEVELNKKIVQRSSHTPLAYIRGKAAFYGREFVVNPHVLVPRPETESIVSLTKKVQLPSQPKIADVGAGSGCIGITLALEITRAHVTLYDIDSKTLTLAGRNATLHHTTLALQQNDLLANVDTSFDLVVANLPYIPSGFPINQAATYEPKHALFSGTDGLDLYRRLWEQLADLQPTDVIIEALPSQHQALTDLAKAAGYQLQHTEGFAQHFKL
jgi:release factor glutamine methyltransferase